MATKPTKNATASLSGWKTNAVHNILLPSNTRVDIRLPDLSQIVQSGELPQHLLDAALAESNNDKEGNPIEDNKPADPELVKQNREFQRHIVIKTVVNPVLTEADFDDLPVEDIEMVFEIATRQRDFDAEYAHIAGLDTSEKWLRFRGFIGSDSTVED